VALDAVAEDLVEEDARGARAQDGRAGVGLRDGSGPERAELLGERPRGRLQLGVVGQVRGRRDLPAFVEPELHAVVGDALDQHEEAVLDALVLDPRALARGAGAAGAAALRVTDERWR
jgi:hypothetical protein